MNQCVYQYADGFFEVNIANDSDSVNNHKTAYSKTSHFVGIVSIIAIYIFSLLSTSSGSDLGDEDLLIYFSIYLERTTTQYIIFCSYIPTNNCDQFIISIPDNLKWSAAAVYLVSCYIKITQFFW